MARNELHPEDPDQRCETLASICRRRDRSRAARRIGRISEAQKQKGRNWVRQAA